MEAKLKKVVNNKEVTVTWTKISAGYGGENLPGAVPRKTARERKSRKRV